MAETFFIQKACFIKLVREIVDEVAGNNVQNAMVARGYTIAPQYRMERDALIALQIATETLFTTIFEMGYISMMKDL
jgi:hypothetical protein